MGASAMILADHKHIDWHDFEASLYDRFAVNAVALTRSGERKTEGDIPWANELCAMIKTNPTGADRICSKLLRILLKAAAEKGMLITGECAAGMNKWVQPIIQDDKIDGFVNICGRPFCNAERIYTDYISRTIAVDEEPIRNMLPCLNPIDPRTLKEMKRYIKGYLH